MIHDEDDDPRIARWLEDGPRTAPARPVLAALEHARIHPRRGARIGPWRTVMVGGRLTRVAPETRGGRWPLAAVAAMVIVAVVGAGYWLVRGNLPDTSGVIAGPTAGPRTPAPTPMPTPTLVTGTINCRTAINGHLGCTIDASDPRIRGQAEITVSETEPTTSTEWSATGTVTITNAVGSWAGSYAFTAGLTAPSLAFDTVMAGGGAYEGLTFQATVDVGGFLGASTRAIVMGVGDKRISGAIGVAGTGTAAPATPLPSGT